MRALDSDSWASPTATRTALDVSDCLDAAKTNWLDYLPAKKRLIITCAEQPAVALGAVLRSEEVSVPPGLLAWPRHQGKCPEALRFTVAKHS